MQSFSLAFCLVRVVRKFDLRLVTTYKMATRRKKIIQCKRLMFLKISVRFPSTVVASVEGLTLAVGSTTFSYVRHLFLTSPLNVDEWSVLHRGRLTPG